MRGLRACAQDGCCVLSEQWGTQTRNMGILDAYFRAASGRFTSLAPRCPAPHTPRHLPRIPLYLYLHPWAHILASPIYTYRERTCPRNVCICVLSTPRLCYLCILGIRVHFLTFCGRVEPFSFRLSNTVRSWTYSSIRVQAPSIIPYALPSTVGYAVRPRIPCTTPAYRACTYAKQ